MTDQDGECNECKNLHIKLALCHRVNRDLQERIRLNEMLDKDDIRTLLELVNCSDKAMMPLRAKLEDMYAPFPG